jgi:TPR repeat protein
MRRSPRQRAVATVALCAVLWQSIPQAQQPFAPVPQPAAVSIEQLKALADGGDRDAMLALAMMHEVGRNVPKDPRFAAQLYERAAAMGDAAAKTQLALMYQTGTGVARDDARALRLFKEAADAGDIEGQYRLAIAHVYGVGTARDPVQARRWMTVAADGAHQEAQLALGIMAQTGAGGPKNEFAARRWLRAAAAGADKVVAQKAAQPAAELDKRLLYSGMSTADLTALLVVGAGLLIALGAASGGGGSVAGTRGPDPFDPLDYGGLSTTRRKQECHFVSRSWGILNDGRHWSGGPGTMRVCY